ncbi:MAG: DUF1553 domain-containing protein [Verrucomicrobiota bacterium]
MDDRESFLQGGDSGVAVVVGKSADSLLTELVMGFDPDSVMPMKGSKLKPEQIALLRAWIDQGLKWDAAVSLGRPEARNLNPHLPKIPANKKFPNSLDSLVDVYFQTNKIKWPDPISDLVFARRAYLDIIGLLPPSEELRIFSADQSKDKRGRLVQKLMSDNRNYAEHWLSFWNDMLRNDYKGSGYIDGGRKQITQWLYSALATNLPYDQFVAQLVDPVPGSEGFSKGIIWRGVVNASQTPPMQAAQSVSQVFMGLNLKCASCHDSFVNDWQLSEAYGLANIFADAPLEIAECDKLTGKKATTRFLYPEFGDISATADKATRLKQLATCITSPKNGRLSRTLVNRLWGRFFGRALVEPVDDMEQAAWNSDLLDWLAEDFIAHGYDVKHLIAQIVTSRAYQLPAVDLPDPLLNYVFRGPAVRRMTAEEFRDALASLAGIGYSTPASPELELSAAVKMKFGAPVIPKWIWNNPNAATSAKPEYAYFRKTIDLKVLPPDATALVTADNNFTLYLNGHKLGSGGAFSSVFRHDLRPFLKIGENVFAAEVINNATDNTAPDQSKTGGDNPAGFIFYARIRSVADGVETTNDFISDKSWRVSSQLTPREPGWEQLGFVDTDARAASELGDMTIAPWKAKGDLWITQMAAGYPGTFRSSVAFADPLMLALGRPNRDQVVTTRDASPTTLQALEMMNGETLADILRRGSDSLAKKLITHQSSLPKLYEQALGRKPTAAEIKLSEEIVGQPVKKEGVEDFLWVMTMMPDFQLIY